MPGYKGFLRALLRCLNPRSYFELSDLKLKQSFSYLVKLIFFAFVIMCLLYLPFLATFSSKMEEKLKDFDVLLIKINSSMKKPVIFFENTNKQVTIYTNSNATEFEKGKALITQDSIVKKRFLFGYETKNITGYSDVLAHKSFYIGMATLLFIALLPTILISLFAFYLLKYVVIAFIVSFVALIVVRLIRYEVDYKSLLNITIFALTPSVLIELFTRPFNIIIPYFRIHWIGYIISLIYIIYGISQTGYFDKERKYKKRRGYLEY